MKFSQMTQRVGNRIKQRLVPFVNGVYGIYNKLRVAVGNPIVLSDSSDKALFGLKIFGKSTQDGTPTPDAPVEIVSVKNPKVNVDSQSISIPYTLHGIPVTSGGNYTDANGQQWICDEVDFERGVYVHRICYAELSKSNIYMEDYFGRTRFYAVSDVITAGTDVGVGFCNAFCVGNSPVGANTEDNTISCFRAGRSIYWRCDRCSTVSEMKALAEELGIVYIFPYATPIETPLTADQIEAYKSLHTNEPNTTISNDQNAWMEVIYTTK